MAQLLPILSQSAANAFFDQARAAAGKTDGQVVARQSGRLFESVGQFVVAADEPHLEATCASQPGHLAHGILRVESFDDIVGVLFCVARVAEHSFLTFGFVGKQAKQAVSALLSSGKRPPKSGTGESSGRAAIPPLIDAGQTQARAGECLAAVESFLRAVEIEPEFMMSSLVWQHIGSVFTGVEPPVWGRQWIRIPEELIPDGLMSRLSRLPNQSRLPGYPGPYVEPPSEAEIVALIADLRSILTRYADRPADTDRSGAGEGTS
jgi:hypothetical protein